MGKFSIFLLVIFAAFHLKAQQADCVFKKPVLTIHFGLGNVRELNATATYNYSRVATSCPTDGHYTYTSYTSDCFGGDWHTITEDHTPGDVDGNMLLVNASPRAGTFLTTSIPPLKTSALFEFSVWMMNVCRPTDKCPFPLLPDINIQLQTLEGKVVASFSAGNLERRQSAEWTPYRFMFTAPASETPLTLVMTDNAPGGCGNDFAVDDISFRECEIIKPVPPKNTVPSKPVTKAPITKSEPKKTVKPVPNPPVIQKAPPTTKPQPKTQSPAVKKDTAVRRPLQTTAIRKQETDSIVKGSTTKERPKVLAPPPTVLVTRSNPVIKRIESTGGEMKIDLYDNGQIDGDTVSIYHNNKLLVSHARLSEKPITFRLNVTPEESHHELVMVAENLGSIPPNTSLMIITSGANRYEVFISSTEQKNAKIIIDLKQ